MIETAPKSREWFTYDDAMLYCLTLKYNGHKDWRMPTSREYHTSDKIWGWYVNRDTMEGVKQLRVTPVRGEEE